MEFWGIIKKLILFGAVAAVVLLGVYHFLIRPWMFRLGATDSEVKSLMAGDGMVVSSNARYTQAITVNAPKDIVWAYIIQMGYRRAGWYNLDFINRKVSNDYFYENNKSADRTIDELQNLKAGDSISVTPELTFKVAELEKENHMLLIAMEGEKCLITWVYEISEIDKNTTRLKVRWTSNLGEGLLLKLVNYFIIDPGGGGIQQRLNLKGIKSRAEATYAMTK